MDIKLLLKKDIIELLKKENQYLNIKRKKNNFIDYLKNSVFKPKYKNNKIYDFILKEYYIKTGNYKFLDNNIIEKSIINFINTLNKKEIDLLIKNKIILNPKKIKLNEIKKIIKENKKFIKENMEIFCEFADVIWSYYSVEQHKYKKEISELNQIKIRLLTIKEKS